ncbi:hypothetical protein VCRA2122O12_360032 [Vibrio crassostreae]|nr:hypothetical protein VCRA2110O3_340009 [Vibrio crassostreae]CAK2886684.1 hypothetical protein VCRA2122O10_350032 [Vibrio crassostreae]CAK3448494.1 hypothetical protein VCRA2122O11_340032 [Vibrio crassostreae]CAK3456002.1 hypothetical protein VCRA2122O12_360032 [Vibrio crassostreae]CAK3540821.1 hypothetical protein VCRA2126E14_340009 [Vibrio crassostreae]
MMIKLKLKDDIKKDLVLNQTYQFQQHSTRKYYIEFYLKKIIYLLNIQISC